MANPHKIYLQSPQLFGSLNIVLCGGHQFGHSVYMHMMIEGLRICQDKNPATLTLKRTK
jgi:hypothetical protein